MVLEIIAGPQNGSGVSVIVMVYMPGLRKLTPILLELDGSPDTIDQSVFKIPGVIVQSAEIVSIHAPVKLFIS